VTAPYTIRPLAWRAIVETPNYLEENSGIEIAERFIDNLISTAAELARMPMMGAPCSFENAALGGLRRWAVHGFENWLVFYLPTSATIEIVHVLHGARNLNVILAGS
jgi:plasmid stabilization system protein ParE